MTGELDSETLNALLVAASPPRTPAQTFAAVKGLEQRLSGLEPVQALAIFAALQTDPAFGSNLVRLDMAMRLVLACAEGDARPSRDKVYRLLNGDLVHCGINRLEDPPENFFLTIAATRRGPYRLFQGVWEKAVAFTEDLLEAFGRLPPSPGGAAAFDRAYALMMLSDLIAYRAGLTHRVAAKDESAAKLNLPNDNQLARLAGRCLISWPDLARLGIDEGQLAPFFLDSPMDSGFRDAEPGSSELERRPLMRFAEGILVVAPQNLSTAARAHLIEEAVALGEGDRLRYFLLDAQSERISIASVAQMWNLPPQDVEGHPVRQTIWEPSVGRPIHLLQIVNGFESVPPASFGIVEESQSLERVVARSIVFARELMRKRPNFREGLSIVYLGGWGRAGSIALPAIYGPDWDVIALEPEDAAAISLAGDGKPMDLWRLRKQLHLIEEQGFEIQGANGWINLFALWRETGRTLIPEHQIDFQPPAFFHFPTNLLLGVREEAARRQSRRSLPLPTGRFEIVTRLDRQDFFDADKPSFVSIDGIRRGEMLGVVVGRRPVWLRVMPDSLSTRAFDTHETWKAAIHWLEVGMPAFDAAFPGIDRAPVLITLVIEWPADRLENSVDNAAIEASISITLDLDARTAQLNLAPPWQHGLHRADNHAELCLAAALLSIISALSGGTADRAALYALMREVVGSDDIRWRHSFVADRPLTLLKAHGLIAGFEEVPASASALVRCGSTFLTRPRSLGPHIEGANDCFEFLMAQHEGLVGRLLATIRDYDRTALVQAALSRLVSALAEEQTWMLSARALRAIYGAEKDFERSLSRRGEINAVIRSASILVEMAASEAPLAGGRPTGQADLDELLAQALLLFQTAELVPPIRAGFIEPKLQISPTGDLLYDHGFTRSALVSSVHVRHSEQRLSADEAYRSHFEHEAKQDHLDPAFEAAVAAEYTMPFDAFVALSGAIAELAVAAGTASLRLRRSELIEAMAALPGYDNIDLRPGIDRLTLAARAGWATLPPGTSASDFDISRFDRHLSLIGRPIVALNADEDPLLLVSPPLMERATLHNLAGAMQGGLQGRFWTSAAMRTFVGAAAEKTGLNFNLRVAEHIRSIGPTAYASVKLTDALHHKGTEAVKRLGDIDVLALNTHGRHAWVIEAKDIRFCRTLAETTSRLSEYRGQIDVKGRRDNLRKHLDRVAYVRAHREDLARRYDLAAPPDVHGLVVLDSPQPMAFLPGHVFADARFVMLADLGALDWSGAA